MAAPKTSPRRQPYDTHEGQHLYLCGRDTPAPVDTPKELVVRGLYRFVRNPMYIGVGSILIGEALLFRSTRLG